MLKCLPFHEEALINWYNIITTTCLNNFLLTCKDFFKGQSHLLRIVEQLIWLHLISHGFSTLNLIFNYIYIYIYCSIPVFMNSNLSLLNVISVMFIISYCLDAQKKNFQFCYCLVLLLLYILRLIWVELNLHMKVKYTSSKLQFSS